MAKESLKQRLTPFKDHSTLQLSSIGRKTGRRHTVTIWFLVDGETVYLATLKMKRDWLQIPTEAEQPFRLNPNTDSD